MATSATFSIAVPGSGSLTTGTSTGTVTITSGTSTMVIPVGITVPAPTPASTVVTGIPSGPTTVSGTAGNAGSFTMSPIAFSIDNSSAVGGPSITTVTSANVPWILISNPTVITAPGATPTSTTITLDPVALAILPPGVYYGTVTATTTDSLGYSSTKSFVVAITIAAPPSAPVTTATPIFIQQNPIFTIGNGSVVITGICSTISYAIQWWYSETPNDIHTEGVTIDGSNWAIDLPFTTCTDSITIRAVHV